MTSEREIIHAFIDADDYRAVKELAHDKAVSKTGIVAATCRLITGQADEGVPLHDMVVRVDDILATAKQIDVERRQRPRRGQ